MSNNKLILRSVNSPWVTPFNDITTGSVLSWADVDNNFIYLKGEVIYSGQTFGTNLILNKINGNDISIDLTQFEAEGNRWHIPSGTTVEIATDYQSFIFGDLYIEGLLKLNDGAQLVVLNGDIILSGGSISGNGTTLLVDLPFFDTVVTGGTFSNLTGDITLTKNDGGIVTIDLSSIDLNDTYTTGATLIGDVIYFNTTETLSAYTADLSILADKTTASNGLTITNTNITLGGTLTGDTYINNSSFQFRSDTFSATTISAQTVNLTSTSLAQIIMQPVNVVAPPDGSMWFTTSGGTTLLNYQVSGVTKSVELT